MSPCPDTAALEAWLSGTLGAEEAAALQAHLPRCAACTREEAWLKAERAWMAQRARRTPARPALCWDALASRLPAARGEGDNTSTGLPGLHLVPPPPPRVRWRRAERAGLALATLAAGALVALTAVMAGGERTPGPAGEEGVAACVDVWGESVEAHELRVGACLVATPVLASR